jgi:hypothetical protein
MLYSLYLAINVWWRKLLAQRLQPTHRLALVAVWLLASLGLGGLAHAQEPDAAVIPVPAMRLPWDCGVAYRLSWTPEEHWAYGKARGVAYDFALPEGTPLYAPLAGTVHWSQDNRPFATNFGNYLEIVSDDGGWLVRLAHLRDPQAGQQTVRAGELVGFSGRSGVSADHLHLELLQRQGNAWVTPDLSATSSLYGIPLDLLVQDAIILHQGCGSELEVAGTPALAPATFSLGSGTRLLLPLHNPGHQAVQIHLVQLLWIAPAGQALTVDIQGDWRLPADGQLLLEAPFWPERAGLWSLRSIICVAPELTAGFTLSLDLQVDEPPFAVAGLRLPSGPLQTGEALAPELTLVASEGPVEVTDLAIEGTRPDGRPWRVANSEPVALTAVPRTVRFSPAPLAHLVGEWQLIDLAFTQNGHRFLVALPPSTVTVRGPQLAAVRINSYSSPRQVSVFLQLRNVGTEPLPATDLEVWGWRGERGGVLSAIQPMEELWPHAAALVQVDVPLDGALSGWQPVEAGYWYQGHYLALPLPQLEQPPAHAEALDAGAW